MEEKELLVPEQYEIFMQDLSKPHIELTLLGTVRNIDEARAMTKMFREAFAKTNKDATVVFRHIT